MEIRSESRTAGRWWTSAWWTQDVRWFALLAVGLITAGHALYGAMLPKTALTLAFTAALLLALAAAHPNLRRGIERMPDLRLAGGLFAAVILLGLLSLTPFAPGGPHPVWSYADISPGAATLDRSQTELELLKLMGLATLFALGGVLGASDTRARTAIDVILALGALVAAWSFLQWGSGALGFPRQRLGGPFDAANTAATLFAVLLVISVGASAAALRNARPRERVSAVAPYASAAALFLFSLLATASRGGFSAAATALLAFAVLQFAGRRASWSRSMVGAGLVLLAVAAAIAVAGDLLVARLLDEDLGDNGRQALFATHWEAFKGSPLIGYGPGTFDLMNRLLLDALNMGEIWNARAAHNVYLTWLQQGGLLGAGAMFGTIAVIMVSSLRRTLRRSRMTARLFGLLAANLVFLVHGMSDFALETYSVAAFWSLLLGLQFSGSQGSGGR